MAEISRAFLGVKGVQCRCDGAAWGIGASGGGASDGGLELCEHGPRISGLGDMFDAILSIATTGCQWRMLPDDFPPVSRLRGCFCAWRNDGLPEEINGKPVEVARLAGGRKAAPTAGITDSQSVNATESGGVRGYDAGKRIKGRKRHIVTDTTGLPVALRVHSA